MLDNSFIFLFIIIQIKPTVKLIFDDSNSKFFNYNSFNFLTKDLI